MVGAPPPWWTSRHIKGSCRTTKSPAKNRRVVPIDAWLADDLRTYLADDHPHGNLASPDYDPAAPLRRPVASTGSNVVPLRRPG